MEVLFRALNELDIMCDPLFNGVASKKLIYDLTYSYLQSNERNFFNGLSENEKDIYCKENMMNYVKTHQYKLKKMIDRKGIEVKNNLYGFSTCNPQSWANLLYYLSTLNTHLSNGSRVYTDWISTSKDLKSIMKYYKEQSIHKVLVLGTASGGLMDDNTIVIDLSNRKYIEETLFLLSKKTGFTDINSFMEYSRKCNETVESFFKNGLFVNTNEKFVGFNYANYDKEVCIYRYYPSECVVSVLEALQIDLISLGLFNNKYFLLDKKEQVLELEKLKTILKNKILKLNDPYMYYVFNELYLNNKNINLIKTSELDEDKIKYNRLKILKLVKNIPNIQIKR